jgi:hypothetical protein
MLSSHGAVNTQEPENSPGHPSNKGAVASSQTVATQAAEEWVGLGARPIFKGGQVVGKISPDGTRIYRITSIDKPDPYINLVNKSTGGNLHVHF